jgi:uncharacterized protein (DUF58 family)
MMLTDTEWLRFTTFALIAGAILGATNTAGLLLLGYPMGTALVVAVTFLGALALVFHAIVRYLLDTAAEREPPADTEADADAEASEA